MAPVQENQTPNVMPQKGDNELSSYLFADEEEAAATLDEILTNVETQRQQEEADR